MHETDLPDLTKTFERAGLIDVAYTVEDSPVGQLLLAGTDRGLVRVAYVLAGAAENRSVSEEQLLDDLAARISPRVVRTPKRLDPARRQLEEYFGGARHDFSIPLDWQLVRGFGIPVLEATAQIPFGEVTTYGGVARAAGNPKAVRATGTALGRNPLPIVVPCHRVLGAGGGFGGYTGGIERKRELLALEGHAF